MSTAGNGAQFIDAGDARLLVVTRHPEGVALNTVLVVPPFGEEMNKTRRMVSMVTDALVLRGVGSVVFDLEGTGDSSGELADVTWARWLQNVQAVAEWSESRAMRVTKLLAIRAGCLLASASLQVNPGLAERCVYWQPVTDGARYFEQLLRTRLAAGVVGSGQKQTGAGLREQLATDGVIEIAGYQWPAPLVGRLESLRLPALCGPGFPPLDWVEIPRRNDTPVSATQARAVEELDRSGIQVQVMRVFGDPFWTSTEIVVNPALVDATVRILGGEA